MSAHDGAEPAPAAADARRRRMVALLGDEGIEGSTSSGSGPDGAAPSPPVPPQGAPGLWSRLQRLCVITAREVGVDGAGVTVMGSADAGVAGQRDQLAATGALTRRLEDLQLTAGEGPCLDAYASGAPVLAPDVGIETTRWLGFAPEAIDVGAAAVFSLPLQVGAVRLGTLDLHRSTTGALSRAQLADALTLATLATELLLELAALPDPSDDPDTDLAAGQERGLDAGWLPDVHAEVHIASGMVSARHGIDVGAALLRIRAHAFASGEPIGDVARRLIDRELVIEAPGTHDPDTDAGGPPGPDAPLESDD